jgi:hypothetical protein
MKGRASNLSFLDFFGNNQRGAEGEGVILRISRFVHLEVFFLRALAPRLLALLWFRMSMCDRPSSLTLLLLDPINGIWRARVSLDLKDN